MFDRSFIDMAGRILILFFSKVGFKLACNLDQTGRWNGRCRRCNAIWTSWEGMRAGRCTETKDGVEWGRETREGRQKVTTERKKEEKNYARMFAGFLLWISV